MTKNRVSTCMLVASALLAGLLATALLTGASSPRQSADDPLATVITFGAKGDGQTDDTEAIREWANERLGRNQRIAFVENREEIPRNPIGKIMKKELREPYWSR